MKTAIIGANGQSGVEVVVLPSKLDSQGLRI
jgi:hypothetical protein